VAEEQNVAAEKEAAKDPQNMISAGGATTTVIGQPRVLNEEIAVGAVKETATVKKGAALSADAEVISNVIVAVVPSVVGTLTDQGHTIVNHAGNAEDAVGMNVEAAAEETDHKATAVLQNHDMQGMAEDVET